MKNIKQLAVEAINVQDASNLFAVANNFAKTITNLKEIGEYRSDHPIIKIWVDKISSMTNMQYNTVSEINKAFDEVEEMAK